MFTAENSRDPQQFAFLNWISTLKTWISTTDQLSKNSREELTLYSEQLTVIFFWL